MTGIGVQIQFVDAFEIRDALPRFIAEGMAAVERVQDDALQQIAERHIVVFSQPLQNLQQTLFQTHARLHSLNQYLFAGSYSLCFRHQQSLTSLLPAKQRYGTYVPIYRQGRTVRVSLALTERPYLLLISTVALAR